MLLVTAITANAISIANAPLPISKLKTKGIVCHVCLGSELPPTQHCPFCMFANKCKSANSHVRSSGATGYWTKTTICNLR